MKFVIAISFLLASLAQAVNYYKPDNPVWRDLTDQLHGVPFSQVMGVTSHGIWSGVSASLLLWNGMDTITAPTPVENLRFDMWENSQHDIFVMSYDSSNNRYLERSSLGTGAFAKVITLPVSATRCLPRCFVDLGKDNATRVGQHLYIDYGTYSVNKIIYYSANYGVDWTAIWTVASWKSTSIDETTGNDHDNNRWNINCASEAEATTVAAAFKVGRVFVIAGSATTANNSTWTIATQATSAGSKITVITSAAPTAGVNTGAIADGKPVDPISHFHGGIYDSALDTLYVLTGDGGGGYTGADSQTESGILVADNMTEFLKGSATSTIDYLDKWGLKDKERTGLNANYCLNTNLVSGKPSSQLFRTVDFWIETYGGQKWGYWAVDNAIITEVGASKVCKINLTKFASTKEKIVGQIGNIAGEGWTWSTCNGHPVFGIASKPASAGINYFDNYLHMYSLNANRTAVVEVAKWSKYYNASALLYSYPLGYSSFLGGIVAKVQTGPTRTVVGTGVQQDTWGLSWAAGYIDTLDNITEVHAPIRLGSGGFPTAHLNLLKDPEFRSITGTVPNYYYRDYPHTYYMYLTQDNVTVRPGRPHSLKLLKGSGGSSKLRWVGQLLPKSLVDVCIGRVVTASAWFYIPTATEATQIPSIGIVWSTARYKIKSMDNTTHILIADNYTTSFLDSDMLVITDSETLLNNHSCIVSGNSTFDGTDTSIVLQSAIIADATGYVTPLSSVAGFGTRQEDFTTAQHDNAWHFISITYAVPSTVKAVGICFFAAGSNSGTITTEQPVYVSEPHLTIGKYVGETKTMGSGRDGIPNGLKRRGTRSVNRQNFNYGTRLPYGYVP